MKAGANTDTLTAVYADLSSIGTYLADDVVLHPAAPGSLPVVGRAAVVAHERALIRATAGTLTMRVQHIVTNEHFGVVLGTLHVTRAGTDHNGHQKESAGGSETIVMPFCGLWRFRDGQIVEHWENDYDPDVLATFLQSTVTNDATLSPQP